MREKILKMKASEVTKDENGRLVTISKRYEDIPVKVDLTIDDSTENSETVEKLTELLKMLKKYKKNLKAYEKLIQFIPDDIKEPPSPLVLLNNGIIRECIRDIRKLNKFNIPGKSLAYKDINLNAEELWELLRKHNLKRKNPNTEALDEKGWEELHELIGNADTAIKKLDEILNKISHIPQTLEIYPGSERIEHNDSNGQITRGYRPKEVNEQFPIIKVGGKNIHLDPKVFFSKVDMRKEMSGSYEKLRRTPRDTYWKGEIIAAKEKDADNLLKDAGIKDEVVRPVIVCKRSYTPEDAALIVAVRMLAVQNEKAENEPLYRR